MDISNFFNDKSVPERFISIKTLRLQFLDEKKRHVSNASGFIVRYNERLFLFTCWHAVTGIDRKQPKVTEPPNRKHVRIQGADIQVESESSTRWGGTRSFEFQLYGKEDLPIWKQQKLIHYEHKDLNSIGIFIPKEYDVIALPIDLPEPYNSIWSLDCESDTGVPFVGGLATPPLVVSGYPYGYSVGGQSVYPVILRRHQVSSPGAGFSAERLLDGACVKGMSGGPVFNHRCELIGIYTGLIFPDYESVDAKKRSTGNDRFAALGTYLNIGGEFPHFPIWLRDDYNTDGLVTDSDPFKNMS